MAGPVLDGEEGVTLVTGATGFVGSHLVRGLAQPGRRVRALVRGQRRDLPEVVEGVRGALDEADAIRVALRGARTVVHAAGLAHLSGPGRASDAFHRVNVEGTRQLVQESARAGVRHFVFLSSIAATCGSCPDPVDESTTAAPSTPYGRSKLEAEALVRAAAKDGMRATILRPPLVYGPGMKGNPLRLFNLVSRGLPLPLASVANRRSLLFVGNLVAAVLALRKSQDAPSATFVVADREVVSTPQLIRQIAGALDVTPRLFPAPNALLRLAGRIGDRLPIGLDSGGVAGLVDSLELNIAALRRTGFEPPHTLAHGLAETAAWYRSRLKQIAS